MQASILIPTYNRPDYLRECLRSCIEQTLLPAEIIIGDDSANDLSEPIVRDLTNGASVPVHYIHNRPGLGQGRNVHKLIEKAIGTHICLIHDDDKLEPRALELLSQGMVHEHVVVSFGKQWVLQADGSLDQAASNGLNRAYNRSQDYAGIQDDLLRSAITQQFPNNGFLINSQIAKQIGYLEPTEIFGDACDFGFAVLCGERFPQAKAYFVNEYTTYYRLSDASILRGTRNTVAYNSFKYILGKINSTHQDQYLLDWLRANAPAAVANATDLGHTLEAFRWYFSRHHLASLLSPGGIARGLRLLAMTFRGGLR